MFITSILDLTFLCKNKTNNNTLSYCFGSLNGLIRDLLRLLLMGHLKMFQVTVKLQMLMFICMFIVLLNYLAHLFFCFISLLMGSSGLTPNIDCNTVILSLFILYLDIGHQPSDAFCLVTIRALEALNQD